MITSLLMLNMLTRTLKAVQGIGSGGILSLTEIILSDLVPLRERGAYQGMIGLIWAIASVIGPIVVCCSLDLISPIVTLTGPGVQGGAFAQRKDWTWRGLFCALSGGHLPQLS